MASRKRKTTESLKAYHNSLVREQANIENKLQGKLVYLSANGPAMRHNRSHVDATLSPTDRYYTPRQPKLQSLLR